MVKRTTVIAVLVLVVLFLLWRPVRSGYAEALPGLSGFNLGNTLYGGIGTMGFQGRGRSSGPIGVQGSGGLSEGMGVTGQAMGKQRVQMA